jgi:hypothetical protein
MGSAARRLRLAAGAALLYCVAVALVVATMQERSAVEVLGASTLPYLVGFVPVGFLFERLLPGTPLPDTHRAYVTVLALSFALCVALRVPQCAGVAAGLLIGFALAQAWRARSARSA